MYNSIYVLLFNLMFIFLMSTFLISCMDKYTHCFQMIAFIALKNIKYCLAETYWSMRIMAGAATNEILRNLNYLWYIDILY
jgi:hypothetical protein